MTECHCSSLKCDSHRLCAFSCCFYLQLTSQACIVADKFFCLFPPTHISLVPLTCRLLPVLTPHVAFPGGSPSYTAPLHATAYHMGLHQQYTPQQSQWTAGVKLTLPAATSQCKTQHSTTTTPTSTCKAKHPCPVNTHHQTFLGQAAHSS